jgi:PAS domain S-box-containing protein
LAESEEQFRLLVSAVQDYGIFMLDPEGRVVSWNDGAERIKGYSAEEILGRHFSILYTEEDVNAGRPFHALEQAKKDGRWRDVGWRVRKDGSRFWADVVISALYDSTGELRGFGKVIRDITERKRMEAQLEANRAQIVSSARLAALGMMAGGVAHEVNNPLAIIHGTAADLLEAAESGCSADEVRAGCRRIVETVERVNKIVKNLRLISRDGSQDPFAKADIGEVVNQAAELCKARFRKESVKLLLPAIAPRLLIDCREVQIAQIVLNLLQNALDAVEAQQGEKWVRVEVTLRDATVVLSVSDSGPAIPADLRERIMEPFFTTKPVGKGTGLGLSISRAVAEDHGGSLRLDGGGGPTRFVLTLPAAPKTIVAQVG